MGSTFRMFALPVLMLLGLLGLVLIVKAFDAPRDRREQDCNRIARTEAAIEGSDREEAKAACMAAADGHAVFFATPGVSDAVRRSRNVSDRAT
jgi:hypothetical protein